MNILGKILTRFAAVDGVSGFWGSVLDCLYFFQNENIFMHLWCNITQGKNEAVLLIWSYLSELSSYQHWGELRPRNPCDSKPACGESVNEGRKGHPQSPPSHVMPEHSKLACFATQAGPLTTSLLAGPMRRGEMMPALFPR